MFRLIALVLTSTFLLLGLFGAGGEPLQMQRAGVAGLPLDLRIPPVRGVAPVRYVAAPDLPLHAAPAGDAGVIDRLPFGARVQLIDARADGFAQVRDGGGRLGYLLADALSARVPG